MKLLDKHKKREKCPWLQLGTLMFIRTMVLSMVLTTSKVPDTGCYTMKVMYLNHNFIMRLMEQPMNTLMISTSSSLTTPMVAQINPTLTIQKHGSSSPSKIVKDPTTHWTKKNTEIS